MATAKPLPDQETLKRLLRYEPETGKLYWKRREESEFTAPFKRWNPLERCKRWNTLHADKEAFTAIERRHESEPGYHVGIFLNVRYKAHRIIWKLVHGDEPETIDHKNGNSADNRLENLRAASQLTNSRNQRLRCTNTSGANGVRWRADRQKWVARCREGSRHHNLGHFDTFEEACDARTAHDRKNGFHDNHGKIRQ